VVPTVPEGCIAVSKDGKVPIPTPPRNPMAAMERAHHAVGFRTGIMPDRKKIPQCSNKNP